MMYKAYCEVCAEDVPFTQGECINCASRQMDKLGKEYTMRWLLEQMRLEMMENKQ